MTKEVFLAAAVRTPIGRFGGALAGMTAADMGVVVARESVRRAGLEPGAVQEVLWGCARQAGGGARVWGGGGCGGFGGAARGGGGGGRTSPGRSPTAGAGEGVCPPRPSTR